MLAAVVVALSPGPLSCTDGTPAWCDRLADAAPLDSLASAVAAADADAADAALAELSDLAAGAPGEIRGDMEEVVATLAELVALTTSGEAVGSDTERRRDRVEQRVAQVSDHTQRVSAWAEEECGLRLD